MAEATDPSACALVLLCFDLCVCVTSLLIPRLSSQIPPDEITQNEVSYTVWHFAMSTYGRHIAQGQYGPRHNNMSYFKTNHSAMGVPCKILRIYVASTPTLVVRSRVKDIRCADQ